MYIDVVFFILLIMAVSKGYTNGLVKSILHYVSVVIALAVAMKFSSMAAAHLNSIISVSDKWLPLISFLIVMLLVLITIRWVGSLIDFSLNKLNLGFANRMGGILFYTAIYMSVWYLILFYLRKMEIIQPCSLKKSVTYDISREIGNITMDIMRFTFPFLKDAFLVLETFFNTKTV